jgi:hypothetical protein
MYPIEFVGVLFLGIDVSGGLDALWLLSYRWLILAYHSALVFCVIYEGVIFAKYQRCNSYQY